MAVKKEKNKLQEKIVFKGLVNVDKNSELVEYVQYKWKCQVCEEWKDTVTVNDQIVFGSRVYSSSIDKTYCDKCWGIELKICNKFEKKS